MHFIKSADSSLGVKAMKDRIVKSLLSGKKVLWLICGGSNLPVAVKVMELVRNDVSEEALALLSIGQTDERYGNPGHEDSNWKQMLDMGFNLRNVNVLPILSGKALEATVTDYAEELKFHIDDVKINGGIVIAQCGIGADGHVAGILPKSPAVADPRLVIGYEGGKYTRVTVTAVTFNHFSTVFTLAFGAPKHLVLMQLRDESLPFDVQPAQILKTVPDSYVYSDQY